MEQGVSERRKERGVGGDGEGGEWATVERVLVGLSSESLARREREVLVPRWSYERTVRRDFGAWGKGVKPGGVKGAGVGEEEDGMRGRR